MLGYFVINDDGRIAAASLDTQMKGAIRVEVSDDFDFDLIHEYSYDGEKFIHDPIEDEGGVDNTEIDIYSRVSALEEELLATKILLGVEE